jgi:hypothetical protein
MFHSIQMKLYRLRKRLESSPNPHNKSKKKKKNPIVLIVLYEFCIPIVLIQVFK